LTERYCPNIANTFSLAARLFWKLSKKLKEKNELKYFLTFILSLTFLTCNSQRYEVLGDSIVLVANPFKVTVQNVFSKEYLFTLRQDSTKPKFTQCLFIPNSTNILITTYKGDSYIWDWRGKKLKSYLYLNSTNFDHPYVYDEIYNARIDTSGSYLNHSIHPNRKTVYYNVSNSQLVDTLHPIEDPSKSLEYFNKLDINYEIVCKTIKNNFILAATGSSWRPYNSGVYYDTLYILNNDGDNYLIRKQLNETANKIYYNSEFNKIYLLTQSSEMNVFDGTTLNLVKNLTHIKTRFSKYFEVEFYKYFYVIHADKKWSICDYSNDNMNNIFVKNDFIYTSKDESYLIQFLDHNRKISLTNFSNTKRPIVVDLKDYSTIIKYFNPNDPIVKDIMKNIFSKDIKLETNLFEISKSGKVLFNFKNNSLGELQLKEAYKIDKNKLSKIEN